MELKEKPAWYEWYICKAWRANYAMNQNDAQRNFALSWGYKTKYVDKPHWCSFSDRNHKVFQDYEKYKKEHPNEKMIVYDSAKEFIKELKK